MKPHRSERLKLEIVDICISEAQMRPTGREGELSTCACMCISDPERRLFVCLHEIRGNILYNYSPFCDAWARNTAQFVTEG